MRGGRTALTLVCVIGLAPLGKAAGEASFSGLGDLPGGVFDSQAEGASADGAVVVGRATTALG